MQSLYQFAAEHPYLFVFTVMMLAIWKPVAINNYYDKPPD